MKVIKRDGRKKEFDESTIFKAIKAANNSKEYPIEKEKRITDDQIMEVVKWVVKKMPKAVDEISVEEIQDLVEDGLVHKNHTEVVRSFIKYREDRRKERFLKDETVQAMEAKFSCSDNQKQNANVDENSFGGRIGEASSVYSKEFALNYMMSEKSAKNHRNFEGYIHDLDKFKIGEHNCLSIPFDDLLRNGASIKFYHDIRSAGSVSTAAQQIVVYFQTQSMCQFGGVSATHLDWTLVPYIRKSFFKYYKKHAERILKHELDNSFSNALSIDDEKYKNYCPKAYEWSMEDVIKETEQAMESMLHNLNTLTSRSGNQLPFTSVCYGRCTLPEGRMVSKALLKAWESGIGEKHLTPIFPCGIFQYKEGINDKPGTPNYDLKLEAIKLVSKRIYPNFSNGDWSIQRKSFEKSQNLKKEVLETLTEEELEKISKLPWEIQETLGFHIEDKKIIINEHEQPFEYAAQMGCRTFNGYDINFTKEYFKELLDVVVEKGYLPDNYLFSAIQKDGRGNIIPCTIVLPFLAMRAKKKVKDENQIVDCFMKILEERIEDVKDELLERFKWISAQPASAAEFMYNNNTMKGFKPEEGIVSAMKHGTFAIGKLGLAECLYILIGKDHTTKEGLELAKRIEQLYFDKCNEYKEKYKLNFGVYETPAENLCFTSMKAFQKKYGLIENVSAIKDDEGNLVEKDFFTNSVHVPVWKEISPFDKIDIESQLVPYSSAGSITYVEIGDEAKNNLKALEQIVDYAMKKDVSYAALNVILNECRDCGNNDGITEELGCCPICGSKNINWIRRITGYLAGDYRRFFNLGKQNEVKLRKQHTKFTNIKLKESNVELEKYGI